MRVAPTLTIFDVFLKTHDILFVNPTASVPGNHITIWHRNRADSRHRSPPHRYIRVTTYLSETTRTTCTYRNIFYVPFLQIIPTKTFRLRLIYKRHRTLPFGLSNSPTGRTTIHSRKPLWKLINLPNYFQTTRDTIIK